MKGSKWTKRIVSVALAGVLGCGGVVGLAACKGDGDKALVIMTEELNGLFNPFYSTAGTDMDVVGQTQISMLATDNEGEVSYGDKEPCLVLDYEQRTTGTSTAPKTEYYFVLKNGLKFSDGYAVTMNDVLFNMYVYLDPAYTGSTTMYSTKIEGLQAYRTQQSGTTDGSQIEDALSTTANGMADDRILELINVFHSDDFKDVGSQGSVTYYATETQMRNKIGEWNASNAYKKAIAVDGNISVEDAREQLLTDYNDTLTEFRTELENDYKAAKDAYNEEPYKSAKIYESAAATQPFQTGFDEVTAFMFMEGFADVEYGKDAQYKEDRTKIERINLKYGRNQVTTQEDAIKHVYNATVQSGFDNILSYWATAGTMRTNFASKAREVILHASLADGNLKIPNISGITSLGHVENAENTVKVHDKEYKLAKQHNEDATSKDFGKPSNEGEYDILKIVVDGTDPKAIWNFGFTVAPYHYYSNPSDPACKMDIKHDKFGVEWGSFDFMTKTIQGTNADGQSKNKIPLGAGPYVATDKDDSDNPAGNAFISDNVVYYKANEHFSLDGKTSNKPKIEKMRYQVVSSSNALNQLKSGAVHFVEPQYTPANYNELAGMEKDGFKSLDTWQLGYGYIGINAGKVKNINLRKAIMAAMNTKLALEYYRDAATNIYWPMSLVSWAYPRTEGYVYNPEKPLDGRLDTNGTDYAGTFVDDETAKTTILRYMGLAEGNYSTSDLRLTFTIAGANLTEHPCFQVFKHAADLLNECGWSVEVMPDVNALIKLSTGSLAVWAAAWGSTIDPDMYQVYDKHSTASSTYAWGYREILASESSYPEETDILNDLSELIMDARETMDKDERTRLYKDAMSEVLKLAVELPVYQRKTLYAYNAKVIDETTFPKGSDGEVLINSYASPLSRIWEIDFKK